ncbi:MAG: pyridoxal-dependent decarboxylase [Lachnospiraceae bacterium]|nr:pyridoxal-dependent decarboxylase [Lachnospiraceae bacterium]
MTTKSLPTPYFMIKEDLLQKDIDLLRTSLEENWGNYVMGYSVKTNALPWLLTHLQKQCFYAEIVSDAEYQLSKHLGFTEQNMIYNGPIKNQEYFNSFLLQGGFLNIDSHDELAWLQALSLLYPEKNFQVGVRVNFDIAAACPEEDLIEEDGGRFGFCYENGALKDAIDLIQSLPNVKVTGLHMHSSSQSRTLHIFAALARTACKVAAQYQLDLSYVDMGGGYYGGRPDKPNYADYFKTICGELKKQFDPSKTLLIVEPGVSLISSATTFVTSVVDVKDIRNHRYVVTDGSRTNLNPMVTRHEYPHHIERKNDNRVTLPSQWITGFTCMEYDRLFECKDEAELLPGDRVIYDTAGGYTMCLNPLFIRYLPSVYVEKTDGEMFMAREQWGIEEFLQKNYY